MLILQRHAAFGCAKVPAQYGLIGVSRHDPNELSSTSQVNKDANPNIHPATLASPASADRVRTGTPVCLPR
jgi:hypothetical protein